MTIFRNCINLMMLLLLTHFSFQFLRDIRCKHLGWKMGSYKTIKFLVEKTSPRSGPLFIKSCHSMALNHNGANQEKKKVEFELFQGTWSLAFSQGLEGEQ